jgi:hypothetical protein
MAHRPYGVRETKPPATDTGAAHSAAWSGGPILGATIAISVLLSFSIYEAAKMVTHSRDMRTLRATGEASRAPTVR